MISEGDTIQMSKRRGFMVCSMLLAAVILLLTACGGGATAPANVTSSGTPAAGGSGAKPLQKVKIQLKWVPQAQFAGIYAAKEKGYFAEEGIDAEIVPGGPDVIIEQQVVNGAAHIGVTSLDSLFVNRDNGLPLVSLAQVSQKSSYRLIAKKEKGIDAPEKMKGKKVGTWMGSQQFQVLAFMEKYGLDPKKDISLVKQGFTMDQFFSDQLDVATATIYNEYYVVLESGVKEADLHVFSLEEAGVAMLEDTLIAKKDWLDANRDLAVKTVRAILKGWNYAIDHQEETVETVMKSVSAGSTTKGHQTTMLMEMAKLVRPQGFKPEDVGRFDDASVKRTADIALKYGLIKKPAELDQAIDKKVFEAAAAK
ncbi:NMT1/THI5 like domain-containing protein [Paenibacillus mucilaginosus 3016]|uniref:Thiamine pyrimidine synthase n=2 Tax=Paenibacillus mucilaginosus TaxID=61624 RepID=H6NHK9_9BACL|nr:NMT1/THI5 like domain-containing protein [Paenibacillus mucilaginosus 3016]WFA18288.1 myristoyl transferase [Paenibacillus mucilaginosus]